MDTKNVEVTRVEVKRIEFEFSNGWTVSLHNTTQDGYPPSYSISAKRARYARHLTGSGRIKLTEETARAILAESIPSEIHVPATTT